MSIEALRKKYYGSDATEQDNDDDDDDDDDRDNENSVAGDRQQGNVDSLLDKKLEEDRDSDNDWHGDSEEDDETTMDREEAETGAPSASDELNALKAESEIPIEQLRAQLARARAEAANREQQSDGDSAMSSDADDGKRHPPERMVDLIGNKDASDCAPSDSEEGDWEGESEEDDETTMEREEEEGEETSPRDELNALKAESELPIEELRAKLARARAEATSKPQSSDEEAGASSDDGVEKRRPPEHMSDLIGQEDAAEGSSSGEEAWEGDSKDDEANNGGGRERTGRCSGGGRAGATQGRRGAQSGGTPWTSYSIARRGFR